MIRSIFDVATGSPPWRHSHASHGPTGSDKLRGRVAARSRLRDCTVRKLLSTSAGTAIRCRPARQRAQRRSASTLRRRGLDDPRSIHNHFDAHPAEHSQQRTYSGVAKCVSRKTAGPHAVPPHSAGAGWITLAALGQHSFPVRGPTCCTGGRRRGTRTQRPAEVGRIDQSKVRGPGSRRRLAAPPGIATGQRDYWKWSLRSRVGSSRLGWQRLGWQNVVRQGANRPYIPISSLILAQIRLGRGSRQVAAGRKIGNLDDFSACISARIAGCLRRARLRGPTREYSSPWCPHRAVAGDNTDNPRWMAGLAGRWPLAAAERRKPTRVTLS